MERMVKPFTPKDLRILFSCADELFKTKSLIAPKSIGDIPGDRTLIRELRLSDKRHLYFTDFGLETFRKVVDIIAEHDCFEGKADYSDIWSAWRTAIEHWLSNSLRPYNVGEVLEAVSNIISSEIKPQFFIVPIFGVTLNGADSFELGSMKVLRNPISTLDAMGISYDKHPHPSMLEVRPGVLWLHGSASGTEKVARRLFSEKAVLTAGLVAIAAAAKYENGAEGFRISTGMTPEDAPGRSIWMSWSETDSHITTHFAFPTGQPFPLNTELSDGSDAMRMVELALATLQKNEKTEIEEAIERAVYWFSDAHRDSLTVMRIVKYWSCVEAFFSLEKEGVTHSVSSGLASILIYGGFRFVDTSEYKSLKKQIGDLYDLRSQAVHRGAHKHITEKDVAQFSQWVAWMILAIVSLSDRGYTTLHQLKDQIDRLDAISRTA
ncbi:HEPN domain-containing protein [Mesorhizobium sp.]|uniref:HEPN domain-containing protein n=1 Tax=Mesorhizobium sp. TaxID=1871066 RepID=UPI00121A0814|nr:HEPN domain-containing protein [Mesorhizobium sp.]TIL35949.1 MAG: hypothetical protein E5Y82_22045 [Mesorhizobium sp.]